MKRIIAAILAGVLVLALCACGVANNDVRGSVSPNTEGSGESTQPFEMGTLQGNTYENAYFGIGCRLDEDWTFSTDDEIQELNGLTADLVGEELKEQLENAAIVYDMMAIKDGGVESMNLNIENVGLAGFALSTEDYVNASMDPLKTALENMGYEDLTVESRKVVFAGAETDAMYVKGQISGAIFEEIILMLKKGSRFASLTIGTCNQNLDELMGCFYALK